MRPEPEGDRRPPDLRLVPGALAAWLVVLLGLGLGPLGGVCAGSAAIVVGVLARRRWPPLVFATAGCAAAAGLVVTTATLLVVQHPLHGPAERGAAATVRAVLRADPVPLRADGFGSRAAGPRQVLVAVSLVEVQVDDGRWSVGGRAVLLAPVEGWAALLPGQEVTADGLLAPATVVAGRCR